MPEELWPTAYRYGDIVLVANFLDPRGGNPKDRPCVIVTDPKVPFADALHRVVAISTVIPDPLPVGYVLLPYFQPRHKVTGLNRRAAAICPWLTVIDEERIIRRLGRVPGRHLYVITSVLNQLSPREEEGPQSPSFDPED